MTMVKKVDMVKPDIREIAMGENRLLPEKAKGIRAKITVRALMITALKRRLTAFMQASSTEQPSALASLIKSISRMPFLTTKPMRAMIPKKAVKDRGWLNMSNPSSDPINDKGMVVNITRG